MDQKFPVTSRLLSCLIFALCLLIPTSVLACDVTLNSGADINAALANYNVVCLSAGTYNHSTIYLPEGRTLRSSTGNRNDVTIQGIDGNVVQVTGNSSSVQNVTLRGASRANGYGVLIYGGYSGTQIWGVNISNVTTGIGITATTLPPPSGLGCPTDPSQRPRQISILDTFVSSSGDPFNGLPDPAIWISCSDNVAINYGEVRGTTNGPGGDGEVAAHHSTYVQISNMNSIDSGASAIYYVNCDNCSVSGVTIHRAGEWGLDIVNGSDNFTASNNTIKWCNWGGSVFDGAGSIGGSFTSNYFENNNVSGFSSYCNGINMSGNPTGVLMSGNVANPAPVYCTPWP